VFLFVQDVLDRYRCIQFRSSLGVFMCVQDVLDRYRCIQFRSSLGAVLFVQDVLDRYPSIQFRNSLGLAHKSISVMTLRIESINSFIITGLYMLCCTIVDIRCYHYLRRICMVYLKSSIHILKPRFLSLAKGVN
jgi:hypothetical protein